MASNYYNLKQNSTYADLDFCLEQFTTQIFAMDLLIEQKDDIIKINCTFVGEMIKFLTSMLAKKPINMAKILDGTFAYVINCLKNAKSKYNRDKLMKQSNFYVEPIELSSGFKSIIQIDRLTSVPIQKTIQTTFMFVKPRDTLTALFNDELFGNIYLEYNREQQHLPSKCL